MAPSNSFLSVYIENRSDLVKYANRFIRDPARAEDVVQEAWLRLSDRDGKGEEISNSLSYLYSVVRNLALDWLRKGHREVIEDPASPAWKAMAVETPSAEDVVYHRDEFRAVMQAIAELPERTQIAFRMSQIEGKTLHEIAGILNISVGRAHQIVRHGLMHASRRFFDEED